MVSLSSVKEHLEDLGHVERLTFSAYGRLNQDLACS